MIKLRRHPAPTSEFTHQREFITWLRVAHPKYATCTRLSLNGIPLPSTVAGRIINQAKACGMVNAESDLFIAAPAHGCHGIFIEMKKPKGKATDEQLEYLESMAEFGYATAVCYSSQDAIDTFSEYLKGAHKVE